MKTKKIVKQGIKIILLSVDQPVKSAKNDGDYIKCVARNISDNSNESIVFYCAPAIPAASKWLPYLYQGSQFENVNIIEINGKHFIDSNSQFKHVYDGKVKSDS